MNNKETDSIRRTLGLSQQEIATVLKVTRSRWSLFELGKRDLPLEAKKKLSEMLTHMKNLGDVKSPAKAKSDSESRKKVLNKLQLNNEYQIQLLSRKMASLEKKLAKNSQALLLANFLNQNKDDKKLAKSITARASRLSEEKGKTDLFKLELKLELLKLEKSLLEAEVKKIS